MEDRKRIREEAIEKILPIVATLTSSEWSRIVNAVAYQRGSAASKLMLDDDTMKSLKLHLEKDLCINS